MSHFVNQFHQHESIASILSELFEGGKLKGIKGRQPVCAGDYLEFSGFIPGQKMLNGDANIAFEIRMAFLMDHNAKFDCVE
jgi:hypothetical protein